MSKWKAFSKAFLAGLVVAAPVQAATFHVEQYDAYLGTDLSLYQAYAANNAADYTANVSYIDFTDDPNGFAGFIPGSMAWPGEAQTGASGTRAPVNDTFFARITATFQTFASDTFTFRTFNDDGVFLFVDGELVINDPSLHAEKQFSGIKALDAGTHEIELFFFENGGEASLEFSFRGQNDTEFSRTGGANVQLNAVPLPATGVVLGSALVAAGFARRRATRAS